MSASHARSPSPVLRALLVAFTLAAAGCSGRGSPVSASTDGGLPEPCREYLEVYAGCMRRLSPEDPQIAVARVASARVALERVTDAEKLQKTCLNGASQLRVSCH